MNCCSIQQTFHMQLYPTFAQKEKLYFSAPLHFHPDNFHITIKKKWQNYQVTHHHHLSFPIYKVSCKLYKPSKGIHCISIFKEYFLIATFKPLTFCLMGSTFPHSSIKIQKYIGVSKYNHISIFDG
jgi:hypothetical protein